MIKVQCYSGYKVKERPISFCLIHQTYQVKEILDRWYGKNSVYFKIKADDENIYLLKYDEWHDEWDLVFYQNPRKLSILIPRDPRADRIVSTGPMRTDNNRSTLLN